MELKSPSTGSLLSSGPEESGIAGQLRKETGNSTAGSQLLILDRPDPPAVAANRPGGSNQGTPGRKLFNYTYSNTYNLTRLTPEEKAALEKRLDEERKRQS